MDDTVNGSLILEKNQPDGTLLQPGSRLVLKYKCEGEERSGGKSGRSTIDYDLPRIDELLTKGFSVEELLRFCSYTPKFKELRDQLPEGEDKKLTIVRRIIEFAENKMFTEVLLRWAEKENSRWYRSLEPYQRDVPTLKKSPADEYAA